MLCYSKTPRALPSDGDGDVLALPTGDVRGFDRLISASWKNTVHPETEIPATTPSARAGPTSHHALIAHSPEHILELCPLTESHPDIIQDSLTNTPIHRDLFYTVKGAKNLSGRRSNCTSCVKGIKLETVRVSPFAYLVHLPVLVLSTLTLYTALRSRRDFLES